MTVTAIDKKVIFQICVIVEDIEKSAEYYRNILGWDIADTFDITKLNDHTGAEYYGKAMDARAKLVGCFIGDIQFELLQPLDPDSVWHDYLEEHGEGIHHIAFAVTDTNTVVEQFVADDYKVTQDGLFTGQTGKYTYLDTDNDLGIIIELLEFFNGMPTIQSPDFPDDKAIGTDVIAQVGIIVDDIEAVTQRIEDVLGMPKAPIIETPGYEISKTTYKGEVSDATAKLAFYDTGQVQIELIEPDEHPSVWRDYLEAHGSGAQHIAFRIKNTQKVVDYLATQGIDVVQQGLFADGSGMYTYMASEAILGTSIELLEDFQD